MKKKHKKQAIKGLGRRNLARKGTKLDLAKGIDLGGEAKVGSVSK